MKIAAKDACQKPVTTPLSRFRDLPKRLGLRSQGTVPSFDLTLVPVRQPTMADNEVVYPGPPQGADPAQGDPIENGNDVIEGEEQEQEIEQETEPEETEGEDEFEDSLEVLPNGRKQPWPRLPPRPKVKLPNLPVPTFSAQQKEDVTVFFDQLENIADIYGWSDKLTLETALASLKTNAHAWAMELDSNQKKDYKKFKSLAIETFKRSVPSWLRSKKMLEVQQRPGQDSQDFAAALRRIQLTLQAPSDAMLSAYLCGLSEKLAQMVAMHDPQSFEEAFRMAKKFEAIVTSSADYHNRRRNNNLRPNGQNNFDQGQGRQTWGQDRPRQWQGERRPAVNDVQKGQSPRGAGDNRRGSHSIVPTTVNAHIRRQTAGSLKDSRDRAL